MDKESMLEKAEAYIEASQKVKAAKMVLDEKRQELVPLMRKLIRADEKGNRTLEFENGKVSLVPQRHVDEDALKSALGHSETKRFTERYAIVATHILRTEFGPEVADAVEEQIASAIRKAVDKLRVPANVLKVIDKFDTEAAIASLPSDEQAAVKVETSQTLRPYPKKEGFDRKMEEAQNWL